MVKIPHLIRDLYTENEYTNEIISEKLVHDITHQVFLYLTLVPGKFILGPVTVPFIRSYQ